MSRFELHLKLSAEYAVPARMGVYSDELAAALGRCGLYTQETSVKDVFRVATAGQAVFEDKGAVADMIADLKKMEGKGVIEQVRMVPQTAPAGYWMR
jgi:hypothetical protein